MAVERRESVEREDEGLARVPELAGEEGEGDRNGPGPETRSPGTRIAWGVPPGVGDGPGEGPRPPVAGSDPAVHHGQFVQLCWSWLILL